MSQTESIEAEMPPSLSKSESLFLRLLVLVYFHLAWMVSFLFEICPLLLFVFALILYPTCSY